MRDKPTPYVAFDSIAVSQASGYTTFAVGNEDGWHDESEGEPVQFNPFQFCRRRSHYRDDDERDELFTRAFDATDARFRKYSQCRYCRQPVGKVCWTRFNEQTRRDDTVEVLSCSNCAWWASSCLMQHSDYFVDGRAVSRMRRFGTHIPPECSSELAQYVRAHPGFLNRVDPKRLELFVADVFRATRKGVEVIHVGRSGDRGVDVVYVDEGGNDWLIQVKRRSSERSSEPFETIQSLAGALYMSGKLRGIVVSTARQFTDPAVSGAHSLIERGARIELIDKAVLLRMVRAMLPRSPWRRFILEHVAVESGNSVDSARLCRSICARVKRQLRNRNVGQ